MKKTKQFKCNNCKDIIKKYRFDQFSNRLIDTRKYIEGMAVCDRCYWKIKIKNEMVRKGTKNTMVGII